MDSLSTYRRLWSLLLARRGLLGVAILGMVGTALATGLFAALTGPCLRLLLAGGALSGRLGALLPSSDPRRLRLALPLALFAVALLRAAFGYLQNSRLAELCLRTIADLQEALHRRLLTLPLTFFEGRHTGELYAQFGSDLAHVERALGQGLVYSLRDVLQLGVLTALAVALDPKLFLIAGAALPIGVYLITRFGRALRTVSLSLQERNAQLLARLQDAIGGATVLRLYGAERRALKAVESDEGALLRDGRRSAALRGAVTPSVELLAYAGIALVLLALQARWLILPADKLVSFFGAVLLAYQPLKSLAQSGQWVVPGLASANRIFALLDAPPQLAEPSTATPLPRSGSLRFDRAAVRYGERWVLQDLDLELREGERVALCGPSGAGKSTLLHLIPRLLDPTAGKVRLRGVDLRQLSFAALRAELALVSQELFLFDATVAENLAIAHTAGPTRPTEAEVEAALELCGALDFVRALPQGLHTRLGERGATLSGGERQRLALARAVLKSAPLLLLDEALSALDPPLEAAILDRLTSVPSRRTLLAVTHRLQSAARFERVLVLDGGKLVEDGTPAALLADNGWFARAYRAQTGAAA